jgi:hypothetical protein
MAKPQPVVPVKLLAAVLWTEAAARDDAFAVMSEKWGEIDFHGPDRPFDSTDYYVPEMGANLLRRLITFAPLFPPELLCEAKLACNEIEDQFAAGERRTVNLDIGYLDHNKIVLASLKHAGQKIHLGEGVYADLIARYANGHYRPFEWTFPDFRAGRYDEELFTIRRRYLQQLRGK